jgi:hypothetical protein
MADGFTGWRFGGRMAHNADLLTCDRHFENLPGVRFVPKTGR